MSDIVMRAAELIAVIVKERVDEDTSGLRAQLMEARGERDTLRGAVDHWHDSSINERVNGNAARKERDDARDELHEATAERDAARAELAGVAAQRDAHLSRSLELAARVTELEAALKRASCTLTATPAAVEVDGFRVGDLVALNPNGNGAWGRVVSSDETQVTVRYPDKADLRFHPIKDTRHKPVEVGDAVRVAKSPFKWRVLAINGGVASLQAGFAGQVADCIAVAP